MTAAGHQQYSGSVTLSEWDGTAWEGEPARAMVRATVPPAPVMGPSQVYPTLVPYLDGTSALGLSAVVRCVTLILSLIHI